MDGAEPDRVDRITLRDHVAEAEIGAFQQERGRQQRLRFSIAVDVRPVEAGDDVDRILSYDTLTEAVASELESERLNLLETLADRVAARVLRHERAQRCRVQIEKLDLGPGALGVEILRTRPAVAPGDPAAVRPVVVHLSNAALDSPRLGAWLDGLGGAPAVLCVDPPGEAAPRAAAPAAQRRIDLLALEQNAWVLAGRDPRCIVTATRTELDWALRRGRLSVWAPSKLVLDTPGAPVGAEPRALTVWLAELLGAGRLIFVGAEPPEGVTAERRAATAEAL